MDSPRRRARRLQPGGPSLGPPGEGGQAPAAASPTYRVVYSSDDSLSDGELHVEHRAGSLSAWYQRGTGRDSDGDGANDVPRPRSVTVVLHDRLGDEDRGDEGQEEGRGQQQGVSWESNTLYDYVRGLAAGGGGGQQGEAVGRELDSEEWAQRSAALRALLRERDGEVAALQALLEQRQAQLEGRGAEVEAAEQRCAALEERIGQLLRELEAAQAAAGGFSRDKGYIAAGGVSPQLMAYASAAAHSPQPPGGLRKSALAPLASLAYPPSSDGQFVQLPAQSYAEHRGCGFWQAAAESVQRHPRRCAAICAALAALLLIILCATLIPAAQRRRQLPRFQAAPSVAAAGASWVDLSVQLDRPGLVSWMAFRQADLNRQVPGRGGATLLELLQAESIGGAEVHAASAPGASLDPAGGSEGAAGLQALAVACGWSPVAQGGTPSRVSVLSASGGAAGACSAAGAGAPARCARCPKLADGTGYTLLLAAASAGGRAVRGVQVLNAPTGDASVNVNSLEPPYADNVTATGFDLHFKLNAPGTLHYAVALDTLYAPYGPWQLAYSAALPSAAAVLAAQPAAFQGGLVANGSVAVPQAGRWVTARVEPPCAGALCQQSLRGLQGGTAYRAYLLAADAQGVADPAPAVVALTTPPATAPPALLPATAPANITSSGFDMAVSQDAAGGVYWLLATAAGSAAAGAEPAVAPGGWRRLDSLPTAGSRRRLSAAADGSAGWSAQPQRHLLAGSAPAAVAPGTLVAPTCYPTNQTCALAPDAAFAGAAGLDAGYSVVASGCTPVPAAGRPLALPPFAGLQNNTVHYLLLATEDGSVPSPLRAAQPAVYAVRTVDLSAPRLACGFPLATNISASGFALSAMLTKPGASAAYVVLPAAAAAAAPPTAAEVLAGCGGGGAVPAAAGTLGRQGWLPWEAAPAAGASGDESKMWASVAGLQGGTNYTAFFALTLDGSAPVPGGGVVELSGIQTPSLAPPSFARLRGLNASVDEGAGTFSVQLSADLDRPGQVFYALYRNYSCITGDPSSADVAAGAALPPSVCKCEDRSYCALATAGSFAVPARVLGAVHGVGGDVSPLPFQSLRNASADQLKCFQGGLGQATDTYNIYLVAGNALPSFTGLAPQCSTFAAAAAAAAGSAPDDACPAARQVACAQAQLRPDSQTLQSGGFVRWGVNESVSAGGAGSPVVWQAPGGAAALGRPARVQLSLEGGTAPAFTYGPAYPLDLRTASSFGMRFALDKPALLIYAVFRVMPIDSSGNSPPPVLIATGRVPVFDAAANATTGPITACPWAPGGAMKAGDQHLVTYVARDKYGRMDGLCPGQAPGAAPRVCTALVGDGGG